MPDTKKVQFNDVHVFTQEEMDMVRLGLRNIKEKCQDPDYAWQVPGEVDTLIKILHLGDEV